MTKIKSLKLSLYLELMKTDPDTLSEDDVDLMYALAKDSDIQQVMDTNRSNLSSAG